MARVVRRLTHAALWLYPPGFRLRHGVDVERAVRSALERDRQQGRAGVLSLLTLTWDLLSGALLEWLDRALGCQPPLARLQMLLDRFRFAFRVAARRLWQRPTFTAITVLTVALGVGANTAVFTLVNGVLLRPMPYAEPEELVFLWSGLDWIGIPRAWMSGQHIPMLRERADRFDGFAALMLDGVTVSINGDEGARRLLAGRVTGDLFELLGTSAQLGRTLRPAEQGPDAAAVAVLTDALWSSRFGADPGIVGRDVRVDGDAYTVVGVLPPEFRFAIHSSLGDPGVPSLYLPLTHDLSEQPLGSFSYAVLGRLGPGVAFEQGLTQLDTLAAEFGGTHYERPEFRWKMVPLHGDLVGGVRPALMMLSGAVALLLAIVCGNLATLFLGRAIDARRETAVRAALGAGLWGRVGPLLLESLLVALSGGVLGVLVASTVTDVLLQIAPSRLPRPESVRLDWVVLGFSLGVAALVGLGAGVLPAWRQRRVDVTEALRDGGRAASGRGRVQRWLVVGQVALSALLLAGAGLMGRSLVALLHADPGFRTHGVLVGEVTVPPYVGSDVASVKAIFDRVQSRLLQLPSTEAVGWINNLPLSGSGDQITYDFAASPGATSDAEHDRIVLDWMIASPGYFEAMGVAMLEGRGFQPSDDVDTEPVVIIDEQLARRFWPDGGAVGSTIPDGDGADAGTLRIVGVARHARLYDIGADGRPQMYRPHAQVTPRSLSVAVRTSGDTAALAEELRSIVVGVDADLTLEGVRDIGEVVGGAVSSWRFLLQMLGAFAFAAVVLAALGVYGVVAVSVASRQREIGIRLALGARAGELGRSVLGQGMRLVLSGLVLAAFGALLLGRLLAGFLYSVEPFDPVSLVAVCGLLVVVAFTASFVPARRATRVSPSDAFRAD